MAESPEPDGEPGGIPEPSHRFTIEGVPDRWHRLLSERATELTITKSALARMILRDWVKKESQR